MIVAETQESCALLKPYLFKKTEQKLNDLMFVFCGKAYSSLVL